MPQTPHRSNTAGHPLHVPSIPVDQIANRIAKDQRADRDSPRSTEAGPATKRLGGSRGAADRDPREGGEPTPQMVRERLTRTRQIPKIVQVPCADHDAPVGEPCYRLGETGAGVCAARITRRAARP